MINCRCTEIKKCGDRFQPFPITMSHLYVGALVNVIYIHYMVYTPFAGVKLDQSSALIIRNPNPNPYEEQVHIPQYSSGCITVIIMPRIRKRVARSSTENTGEVGLGATAGDRCKQDKVGLSQSQVRGMQYLLCNER